MIGEDEATAPGFVYKLPVLFNSLCERSFSMATPGACPGLHALCRR